MSKLLAEKERLRQEVEDMIVILNSKDDKIALLKAKLVLAQTEGPGSDEVVELKAKILIFLLKLPISKASYLTITLVQSFTQNTPSSS